MARKFLEPVEAPPSTDTPDRVTAVDARLVDLVRRAGAASAEFKYLESALVDFGVGTLTNHNRRGELFSVLRRKGLRVRPQPRSYNENSARLIYVSVHAAARSFMHRQILGGGWDASRSTSVSTFFVNACFYSFADEFDKFCREEAEGIEELVDDVSELAPSGNLWPYRTGPSDPERTAIARDSISALFPPGTDPRLPVVFLRVSEGCTHADIGEELGLSAAAVGYMIKRYRRHLRKGRH